LCEDGSIRARDRKDVTAEVLKLALKHLRGEQDPGVLKILRTNPEEAFVFLPDIVPVESPFGSGYDNPREWQDAWEGKRTGSTDLDQAAEGIFKGISPTGDPWHGDAPEFHVSFAEATADKPNLHSVRDETRVSATIESGSDGAYAESHLFWQFLKAYPNGEHALLGALSKFFTPEIPRLKREILQHYTDKDFATHMTMAVFGWNKYADWEDPTDVSIGNIHFGKPRVSHSTLTVPWSAEVSFTTKQKAPAKAVFSGMSDRELNTWIEKWEGQAPENFWMDGELRATRPQAYKMYRQRWRQMSPREQQSLYESLSRGGRYASVQRVAAKFLQA
jgi:hypothetical protein